MRFDVDQTARARDRRMIRRRRVQLEPQKAPHAQRIGRPPRDRPLGVEPFEVPEQQHADIATRRQAGTTDLVGVTPSTEPLDIRIESRSLEDLIQSPVERMRGTPRHRSCVATHIDACVARRRCLPMAMRDSVVRGIDRVDPFKDFHHGLLEPGSPEAHAKARGSIGQGPSSS